MKFLIITYDDYRNIPYIHKYEECIRNAGGHYDIILWNREGMEEDFPDNFRVFNGKDTQSKLLKLLPFYRWRCFVKKCLKEKRYDRIIVLTTIPAVLISDILIRRYKDRYWLDIRDFTYENHKFYMRIVDRLLESASDVSISSPGFYSFVPEEDKVHLTHNIANEEYAKEYSRFDSSAERMTIGFVGGVRYFDENKKLIRAFANNSRYLLRYIGKEHPGCDLRDYCRKNGIVNVEFLPSFDNSDKPELYTHIDIINSIYGSFTEVERIALPNRLYDAALYKIPILVSQGTLLGEIVGEYDMGLQVDINDPHLTDRIEEYISKFDRDKFESGCSRLLDTVYADESEYIVHLNEFCSKEIN